ncbi:MAG TPA: hypothetical protein VF163_07765 [Micromonosporaceae bacterium]
MIGRVHRNLTLPCAAQPTATTFGSSLRLTTPTPAVRPYANLGRAVEPYATTGRAVEMYATSVGGHVTQPK